jgi:hypothetical protein
VRKGGGKDTKVSFTPKMLQVKECTSIYFSFIVFILELTFESSRNGDYDE